MHKRIWQAAQHYCSARCELARGEGTPGARTGNAGLAAHAALKRPVPTFRPKRRCTDSLCHQAPARLTRTDSTRPYTPHNLHFVRKASSPCQRQHGGVLTRDNRGIPRSCVAGVDGPRPCPGSHSLSLDRQRQPYTTAARMHRTSVHRRRTFAGAARRRDPDPRDPGPQRHQRQLRVRATRRHPGKAGGGGAGGGALITGGGQVSLGG